MERKKKRGWFERIKRLFVSEPKQKPNPEKKSRSRSWLVGKLKTQQSFALPAPAPEHVTEQIRQAEDEQSRHVVAVAIATAAAAEAAVAAARAASEVVRLTGQPAPSPSPAAAAQAHHRPSSQERAAVVIQSVYRGYLARRALRALKGLVRLQALIRGQAVRRQTAATLRGLESLIKIQARQRAARASTDGGVDALLRRGRDLYYSAAAHEQEEEQEEEGQGKGWDSSILSKEEMSALMRNREEAALKRIRALQYASLHNEKIGLRRQGMWRDELETLNQRWSWLEEWVGSQPFDKDIPVAHQSPCRDPPPAVPRSRDAAALPCVNPDGDDGRRLGHSARRSFARPRRAAADDDDALAAAGACSPAPPLFPGYMASTASAKAKFRSMSTPKERSGAAASDVCHSEQCFPFADGGLVLLSPIPSIASDVVGFARSSRMPAAAQRSPRVKGQQGPMTPARSRSSRRSTSHHSFGSEAALLQLQMEQYTPIR